MRIYIAHSTNYDYQNELYKPIREDSNMNQYNIIFPHEYEDSSNNTRDFYNTIDLVIAECSYPATGVGIELGWLYDDKKPIHCIYKKNSNVSGSLKFITNNFYEYEDTDDMLRIIEEIIKA